MIFTNLEVMIKCLLIGFDSDIEKYAFVLSQSLYFQEPDSFLLDTSECFDGVFSDHEKYHAFLLVSKIDDPLSLFIEFMKAGKNLYFVDQEGFTANDLPLLVNMFEESGSLLYPEIKELHRPLFEDFITVDPSRMHYSYTKSLASRKDIRTALISALGLLSLLSPVPVKKIDVSTIETTSLGRPAIKVRLKMYDSSVCFILLDIDNMNDYFVEIESSKGKFHFNVAENYIENQTGDKFYSDIMTDDGLLLRTIDAFAMNIIMNSKPSFSFLHYLTCVGLILKIENILKNSL